MNFIKSPHFGGTDASSPPRWKTLVKRKAWGGFWRPLCREVSIFTQNAHFYGNHGFSQNQRISPKFCVFRANGDFAVKGPPETAPGLTFIKGFRPRRRKDIHFTNWSDFKEVYRISWNGVHLGEFSENRNVLVKWVHLLARGENPW